MAMLDALIVTPAMSAIRVWISAARSRKSSHRVIRSHSSPNPARVADSGQVSGLL
jgi:hypothetical protein